MSKSLKTIIMENIEKQAGIEVSENSKKLKRLERKRKIETLAKEDPEKCILFIFQDELSHCLKNHVNYWGHSIYKDMAAKIENFGIVSEKLGFKVEETRMFMRFSVPVFRGGQRTIAQTILQEFEQNLSNAIKERKQQIITECKRVKDELIKGNFTYRYLQKLPYRIIVCVESNKDLDPLSCEDIETVFKYFKKYGFIFNYAEGKWYFMFNDF